MADVTEESVQAKISAGEALTDEETKFVMGFPNPEEAGIPGPGPNEDVEDIVEEKKEEASKASKEEKKDENADSGEKKDKEDTSASEKKDEKKDADKTKTDEEIAAEAKAKEEEAKEKEASEKETLKDKLDKELDKPDGTEDLSNYNDREKGLFFELRNERRKRQTAEEDRDGERFQRIKDDKLREAVKKKAEEDTEAAGELNKLLEGEDEFVSKDVLKKVIDIVKKPAKDTGSADEINAANRDYFVKNATMGANTIIEARRLKGDEMPDFDKVMELGPEIIEKNDTYKMQLAKAYNAGKNPALLAYDLIRKDPKFIVLHKPGTAKKEEKKESVAEKGKKNLEKINKNLKKPNTSGKTGGGGSDYKDEKSGKTYSLVEIANMSTSEFRKVPREIREKFLKSA